MLTSFNLNRSFNILLFGIFAQKFDMRLKRYETWTKDGKMWSDWFEWDGLTDEKWQLKNKLKNEFKEVSEEEWKAISEEQDKQKGLDNEGNRKRKRSKSAAQ